MKEFVIEHIDPLGQGVFKKEDKIYFIPKTLPGEQGQFEILKKKKGVHFCKVISLSSKSKDRIKPECSHFENCNGCHFLHTDYSNELNFKKMSFDRLLGRIQENSIIDIIRSPHRLQYRNRVQLHYDTKQGKIGFLKQRSNKILSVPNCQIFDKKLLESFQSLLKNWRTLKPKNASTSGHVEIYLTDNKVLSTWNAPYASGGFTQVNSQTNQLMLDYVKSNLSKNFSHVLDLFGGKGNISEQIQFNKRTVVDIYPDAFNKPDFISLNLFKKDALETYLQKNLEAPDLLIVDPPRSGFKELTKWIDKLAPKYLLYISCHPATMIRDLLEVSPNYKINKTAMIDLFPGTYHFEGLILLEKQEV